MAERIGQPERVDALAAIHHDIGQPGPAEEHSDHRPALVGAARQCDQLAHDDVRAELALGEVEQALKRRDRVTVRAKVERDKVGLAARQHCYWGRIAGEMLAVVKLGQRRLDGAVAAVDDQQLGLDPGDRRHRFADLVGALDFVMEQVGMRVAKGADLRQLGDIAR